MLLCATATLLKAHGIKTSKDISRSDLLSGIPQQLGQGKEPSEARCVIILKEIGARWLVSITALYIIQVQAVFDLHSR